MCVLGVGPLNTVQILKVIQSQNKMTITLPLDCWYTLIITFPKKKEILVILIIPIKNVTLIT